jgi:hypothetical protein
MQKSAYGSYQQLAAEARQRGAVRFGQALRNLGVAAVKTCPVEKCDLPENRDP